ncbi:MAG TPA: TolC family protein [Steroidobacteraceae bacterium]|nr:TolC family protein [Steroidobacteraceae bacterium]HRX88090.1 TolC family protein [Steroidobacteraceae bacterium]
MIGRSAIGPRSAALWLSLLAAAAAHAEPTALTLPEAIATAMANNPRSISQRLQVEQARAGQRAARGARLPSIDLTAGSTRYGYPTFVHGIRQVGVFPPLDEEINSLGVAFRLPIYTGGKLTSAIEIADLGREIAIESERSSDQELIYNVSAVYLKIQQLDALALAFKARIESLHSQGRRVELLRDVGRAAKLDQLRIAGQVTKARYDLLQIENRAREARTALYLLMGTELPAAPPVLTRYVAAAAPKIELAEARELAPRRPDVKIAERQVDSAAAGEALARADRRPMLSLVSGFSERSGSEWQFYDDWSVGLQLSMPLFDGGVRRAHIDQAVLARRQAEQLVVQKRLEAQQQIENAWHARAEAAARLDVTDTSIAEAHEVLAIEQLKLEQGVGAVSDVLTAETTVLTAQADRLQAEFDVIVAAIDLLRARGSLDPSQVVAMVAENADSTKDTP